MYILSGDADQSASCRLIARVIRDSKLARCLTLTFALCAAGHGVDRGDGPGETKPLFLQLALLQSGALVEDFDHSILLQELSVKCTNPKHIEHTVRPKISQEAAINNI